MAVWRGTGVVLPYPKHVLGLEIFGMLALFLVELARSYMGSKANKTQRAGLMVRLPQQSAYACAF